MLKKKDQKWVYAESKFVSISLLLLIVGLKIVLLDLASE
jgi:hypothetical protein